MMIVMMRSLEGIQFRVNVFFQLFFIHFFQFSARGRLSLIYKKEVIAQNKAKNKKILEVFIT